MPADFKPFPKAEQLARGPHKKKVPPANKKRKEQLRAAKDGPCRCCGGAPPNELHHLVPRGQGGLDQNDNLVPLCHVDHDRVGRYDREACALLRRSLTDGEYAYAVDVLGEARFAARYPVDFETIGRKA